MKKQRDRSAYLFDNKALRALIIPLIIEQLLRNTGRYGGFDYDSECRRGGGIRGVTG